jgi:hypothetical protein
MGGHLTSVTTTAKIPTRIGMPNFELWQELQAGTVFLQTNEWRMVA